MAARDLVARLDLDDLPWWAGVLLTVADMTNRHWLTVGVWVLAIGRGGLHALRSRRRRVEPIPPRPVTDELMHLCTCGHPGGQTSSLETQSGETNSGR